MRLGEVIDRLETFTYHSCIFARRPWSSESEAEVFEVEADFQLPQSAADAGLEYFLEVYIARDEVLEGLDFLSKEQRLKVVLYYAEFDAFPEWLNELCRGRLGH